MKFANPVDARANSFFGKLLRLPLRFLPGRMVVPVLRGVNKKTADVQRGLRGKGAGLMRLARNELS